MSVSSAIPRRERPSWVEEFDARREIDDKAFRSGCYSPFATFDLDPQGYVLACCMNSTYPLGNVGRQRLQDIWHGKRATAIRAALESYDFSYGCGSCRFEIRHGKDEALIQRYDKHPITSRDVGWPIEIGFALSNTCNLECVQCNGELSSRIRSRREKRPPLPKPYGDQFFEDLYEFLPHLEVARFIGGEPFLCNESYRVWDMLGELNLTPFCHVTTNGTTYNARVEAALAKLPMAISLSIDGVTKETFESIRVNAKYDEVMQNIRRFREYTESVGTSLGISHCLMRSNWRELGDMLRWADELGAEFTASTVFNEPFSLYSAPIEELEEVVSVLEAQSDAVMADLDKNAAVWEGELELLRTALRERQRGTEETVIEHLGDDTQFNVLPEPPEVALITEGRPAAAPKRLLGRARNRKAAEAALDAVVHELRHWAADRLAVLEVDADGVVTTADRRGDADFYGVEPGTSLGRSIEDLLTSLKKTLGPHVVILDRYAGDGRVDTLLGYTTPPPYSRQGTWVRVVVLPSRVTAGGWTVLLASDEFYPPVPLPGGRSEEGVPVELVPRRGD